MNIKELIASSSKVAGYNQSSNLSKNFGKIFLYNKKVNVESLDNLGKSIIEVSMMISGLTDKVNGKPVAAHKVEVLIEGAEVQKVSQKELISLIRQQNNLNDEEKNPSELIIANVNAGVEYFDDITIIETNRSAGRPRNDAQRDELGKVIENVQYLLIKNNIPDDSNIQVHCSCSSYYWTFLYYNCEKGVDIYNVPPKRYIPKTKKGYEAQKRNQPLRNPGRNAGMCKHITLLLAMLMDKGTVQDTDGVMKRSFKVNIGRLEKSRYLSRTEYSNLMTKFYKDRATKTGERNYLSLSAGYKGTSVHSKKTHYWNSQNKWTGKGWSNTTGKKRKFK